MLVSDKQFFIILGLLALGGFVVYRAGSAVAGTVKETITVDLNPVNDQNLANRGFSALYGGGLDGHGTLGTDIYEMVHEDAPALFHKLTGGYFM